MIVHFLGFPGVGKYSIARSLSRLAEDAGSRIVMVDNHLSSNVLLSVIDADGVSDLPEGVWDRVGEIREVLYSTIEDMSPAEWSFAFTNVLVESDPRSPRVVERVKRLAAARSTRYVPVTLHCDPEELARRVPASGRAERLKWIDAEAVRAFADRETLLNPPSDVALHLDVTRLGIDAAAEKVLDHLRSLEHLPGSESAGYIEDGSGGVARDR